ncbi:MAG: 16S rRNA (guanine(527)-N(7))-methyltransferase RsmG [Hyphomicrobiales bacterium]|nr:16S rRNA (guanine(527)-N(7))-methyltransferase RsmG [Hyphomicrobiales bacterium]
MALRLVSVSRETEARLAIFVELLDRWRGKTNLIADSTFPTVWTRHIADSAQLIALAPDARRWVDMGSGAGFPGLVIAIQLVDVPGAIVHCIESDGRKCAFLREAARATGAAAQIHALRVEAIAPESLGPVDAVTARAFAPLPMTLKLARPWIERGAIAVFPRGESARGQIDALPDARAYAIESLPSVVNPKAAILRIRQG